MSDPDPEEIDQVREFIQDILGEEYTVETPVMVEDDDDHTVLGLVVYRKDGSLMSNHEVYRLFQERGVEVHGPDLGVPDTVPDDFVGGVEPEALNEQYGPTAGSFVDQLGRLLNLEWTDSYNVMVDVVQHMKRMGLSKEAADHLGAISTLMVGVSIQNRMYLAALMEAYRRDHDLSSADMEVLLKSATARVTSLAYEKDGTDELGTEVITNLRSAYLGPEEFKYSWPPINQTTFSKLWDVVPPIDE